MDSLIEATSRLVNDIKRLQLEIQTSEDFETLQEKEKQEGVWLASDIVKEIFFLSDNFSNYKRGLVKVPSLKLRAKMIEQMSECTFKPKVNPLSAQLDLIATLKNENRVAGKIYRRSLNSDSSTIEKVDPAARVEVLMEKEALKNLKIERER